MKNLNYLMEGKQINERNSSEILFFRMQRAWDGRISYSKKRKKNIIVKSTVTASDQFIGNKHSVQTKNSSNGTTWNSCQEEKQK